MTINDRFKRIRKELCFTQTYIGKVIGVTKSRVSAYENDEDIPERAIKTVCKEFDINEDWLRQGTGSMFKELSREEEIASYMGGLLASEDDDLDFQKRFIRVLSKLDTSDWKTIEKIVNEMVKENEKD